jgi:hypothetical protein
MNKKKHRQVVSIKKLNFENLDVRLIDLSKEATRIMHGKKPGSIVFPNIFVAI